MTSTFGPSTPGSRSASASCSRPEIPVAHNVRSEAEALLFERILGDKDPARAPVIFVLGSPRTGSTRVYQALARFFRLPYFCNLANDAFPDHPILVGPILREMKPVVDVRLDALYGKTAGPFQPSEASAIMTRWCGGGHPSATVSAGVLPGRERHLVSTVAAMHGLFGAPLVIKNAWHCFRIASLASLLPAAHFVWVRRDITASALSDLAARYVTRGDPNSWNSATPANVADLECLPYWAQVVENQYEFARSIQAGIAEHAAGRHSVLWFEDAIGDPTASLRRLAADLGELVPPRLPDRITLGTSERTGKPFRPGDEDRLRDYVRQNHVRLSDCEYPGANRNG